MLKNINLEKILVLDIETVPIKNDFTEISPAMQALWEEKTRWQRKEKNISASEYYENAGIYAEFGKIICISVGYFKQEDQAWDFRIKSFYNHDETEILHAFASLVNTYFCKQDHLLCGHNSKEFDFPFIARRMLINHIPLPSKLDLAGKKPWEVAHIDTMDLWKFGDYKHYTSLNLLAAIFNIPSPKDDISGKDVRRIYWEENNLERIKIYCEKDVITVANLLLHFRCESFSLNVKEEQQTDKNHIIPVKKAGIMN